MPYADDCEAEWLRKPRPDQTAPLDERALCESNLGLSDSPSPLPHHKPFEDGTKPTAS